MSAESGYHCPKCGFTWESVDSPLKCFNCGLDYPETIESRATLKAEVESLRAAVKVAVGRLESLLVVHGFIDDETGHQTKATKAVLATLRPLIQKEGAK